MRSKITLRISFAVLALAMVTALLPSAGGRAASNLPTGSLDPTFDLEGKVTPPAGLGMDRERAMVIQPDGKIVASNDAPVPSALHRDQGKFDKTLETDL